MARQNMRDDQWERIEHLLPGKASDRGRTGRDNRLFVEAILWLARSGARWRDLPEAFKLEQRVSALRPLATAWRVVHGVRGIGNGF